MQTQQYSGVAIGDLARVARAIAGHLGEVKVWLFHGELGAGKTTLIKEVGSAVGVQDDMSSPSFSIVNEYLATGFERVYHFDFYRIKSEVEAMDIGVEEYFDSGYPCLIEWPEKIPSLIPEVFGEVSITIENEKQRTIAISVHAGKEENRV
jgi:tRNA threonylcarbamoyladenosine biosynthesis protein TsaE